MAAAIDPEFWKNMYDEGGNHPASWFKSAHNLLLSADVLEQFAGDYHALFDEAAKAAADVQPQLTKRAHAALAASGVSSMLRAMATECLLKSLWLKHGGTLTNDGKYVGVTRKNDHRLDEVARAVAGKGQISFTDRELALLEQASYLITTGRYPIQLNYRSLVPREYPDGTIGPAQFWRGNPKEELKALISKLQAGVGIRMP